MATTQSTDATTQSTDHSKAGITPGIAIAGILLGIGSLWYLFAEAIAAAGFPGYSYANNFISDLGVPEVGVVFEGRHLDSQLAIVMNAGFLGQALAVTLAGVLLWWSLPAGRGRNLTLVFAIVHSFGIALVGLVHGSPANNDAGFMVYHGLGAGMAILGGNALAILAGRTTFRSLLGPTLSRVSIWLGVCGLLSEVVTFVSKQNGVVDGLGLSERGGVYSIMVWQLIVAAVVLRARRVR
ncbi:DUF998 domain-containing protein [Streptomyces sp. SAS_270]|uniref:DUF998 domain-containing protein n=1 Tax=Streptomyces sp. SAS_270 TaxID=3412748 RepID=UPI00403CF258